ncbi:MAG TPA: ATP-dependent protease subunit HslV [bacterium]|nr:ATP-dependent protease subunit HslV [bacterium]
MKTKFTAGSGSGEIRGTTIVAVRRGGKTAFAGDGQVTFGDNILKHTAVKVRRMAGGRALSGFAGSVSDALTLFERFEEKLEKHQAGLYRAAMEFVKEWRTDKYLRKLEAMLLVADKEHILILSGTGEVIESDGEVAAIGSGGALALAAARALVSHTELPADAIAREALKIASDICIHTNDHITVETLE